VNWLARLPADYLVSTANDHPNVHRGSRHTSHATSVTGANSRIRTLGQQQTAVGAQRREMSAAHVILRIRLQVLTSPTPEPATATARSRWSAEPADRGVDVTARSKDGRRIAVQCERQIRTAPRSLFEGLSDYGHGAALSRPPEESWRLRRIHSAKLQEVNSCRSAPSILSEATRPRMCGRR
jgi:hypothetical protein